MKATTDKPDKRTTKDSNFYTSHRMWVAIALTVVGVFLLIASLFMEPTGEIHPSVIGAAGEVFTFGGALFGIKLNFDRREMQYKLELERLRRERPLPEDEH